MRRQLGLEDIGLEPLHRRGTATQPRLRHGQRGARKIENRHVLMAAGQEVIDEGGRAAAHVDDRRIRVRRQPGRRAGT